MSNGVVAIGSAPNEVTAVNFSQSLESQRDPPGAGSQARSTQRPAPKTLDKRMSLSQSVVKKSWVSKPRDTGPRGNETNDSAGLIYVDMQ